MEIHAKNEDQKIRNQQETTLINQVEEVGENLLAVYGKFAEEDVNVVPFENSWTASQVIDHLMKSYQGIDMAINGKSEPAHRKIDENAGDIRNTFLDFSVKFDSPKEILPGTDPIAKQEAINKLKPLQDKILKAAQSYKFDELCVDFGLPVVGNLTRFEWFTFYEVHTKRHIWQLSNIYNAIQQQK